VSIRGPNYSATDGHGCTRISPKLGSEWVRLGSYWVRLGASGFHGGIRFRDRCFVFSGLVGSFAIFTISRLTTTEALRGLEFVVESGDDFVEAGGGFAVEEEIAGEEAVARGVAGGVAFAFGRDGATGFSAVFAG
jgi:hypothetical protein